ncbi:MAG: nucleotidyl transferase AbiEii/AbiGii toxin family protein [Terrimicrobiaceae bacterium]|nr:nucleotidyl transferase AbiEii/AbiGii toxin family protein [Terrimicrobiaceae bacterium]
MNDQPRHYASAAAFRVALEARLMAISAAENADLQRLRRQVSFDRLLARFFAEPQTPWLLKGGYAMELRLRSARTTKDIDLSLPGDRATDFGGNVLDRLQESAQTDLGDFFAFTIGAPQMDLTAAPQGGARYPVAASLAGRIFTRFHLDVGIGDAVVPPTELIVAPDWLGFAGIAPPRLIAISKEQQFAEKLHALTRPRTDVPNSRVKDLVDLVLLIQMDALDRTILRQAIEATFAVRGTHAVPTRLPTPPEFWRERFPAMARESRVELSLDEALRLVAAQL